MPVNGSSAGRTGGKFSFRSSRRKAVPSRRRSCRRARRCCPGRDMKITADIALQHGLSAEEYERIESTLGRAPTLEELGVFSVMWSEHCSYKSSRVHLRGLPTTGPRVLQGPGENAGAI